MRFQLSEIHNCKGKPHQSHSALILGFFEPLQILKKENCKRFRKNIRVEMYQKRTKNKFYKLEIDSIRLEKL